MRLLDPNLRLLPLRRRLPRSKLLKTKTKEKQKKNKRKTKEKQKKKKVTLVQNLFFVIPWHIRKKMKSQTAIPNSTLLYNQDKKLLS
jgi:hypothetical protein